VPYIAAHPIEFQTLGQWALVRRRAWPGRDDDAVALPEIDGATNPTVFGGRHGPRAARAAYTCPRPRPTPRRWRPAWSGSTAWRKDAAAGPACGGRKNAEKKVGIVLFGFPPNAGAVGTAAYLSVFESLFNTLTRMKADGYAVEVPPPSMTCATAVLHGNAKQYGQEANVAAHVDRRRDRAAPRRR
jgi:magnesium chelatase subunit H